MRGIDGEGENSGTTLPTDNTPGKLWKICCILGSRTRTKNLELRKKKKNTDEIWYARTMKNRKTLISSRNMVCISLCCYIDDAKEIKKREGYALVPECFFTSGSMGRGWGRLKIWLQRATADRFSGGFDNPGTQNFHAVGCTAQWLDRNRSPTAHLLLTRARNSR